MSQKLLDRDLDYVIQNTAQLWEVLRNQRIFITGGTGFFGCWLLESFCRANKHFELNASVTVLSRNIEHFKRKCPHLFLDSALEFHQGDVLNFSFPTGHFSHVIHAATDASVALNKNNPELMFDTIVQGTKNALEFARQSGAQQFLLTSSGAVYGKQPAHITHVFEDFLPDLNADITYSAYAEGKRIAEKLCAQYAEHDKMDIKIARCFAFIGPYLPLDSHFAIGNFIRDGLLNNPINVASDGTSYRSYLYAADLAIWLWTILFRGEPMRPYNVGSDKSYTIAEIAKLVGHCFEQSVVIQGQKKLPENHIPERYVPDVSRVETELNLVPKINLEEAIQLTKEWYLSI